MEYMLADEEQLRAWAIKQSGGDVERARAIVEFVRPPELDPKPYHDQLARNIQMGRT